MEWKLNIWNIKIEKKFKWNFLATAIIQNNRKRFEGIWTRYFLFLCGLCAVGCGIFCCDT